MNLKNKLKYILGAPRSHRLAKKYPTPNVMTDEQTLDYILENGCSICRYGDGEFNLMRGVGIKFQSGDETLTKRLNEIAKSRKDNVLLCVPDVFRSLDSFLPEPGKWWKNYLRCTRGYWYKTFGDESVVYGDTNITRFYAEYIPPRRADDGYIGKLKTLWRGKRVLIAEGAKSRMGMGNDLFDEAKDLKRLLCPAKDAFASYDAILSALESAIRGGGYDLLLCALGPTATVLCYDLADEIQALDMGHMDIEYEWFLMKADGKRAVGNKAVTEVTGECGDNVTELYKSQIIGSVGI